MSEYTTNPTTVKESLGNVIFQLDNVRGWVSVDEFENAEIKARCLLEAAQNLVEILSAKTATLTPPYPS